MVKSSFKSIISGSFWGVSAKILDALAKFVTIPMLVGYYGKADYGLIALAFSLNAYLRLMDLGMNVGSIRFFSIWISKNEWQKIGDVSRSSIVFYGAIGIINALIFVIMAQYGAELFNITSDQTEVFKFMMYILAVSTVFNWVSNVVTQLLTAHNELGWINRITIISSLFNFLTAFCAIQFKFDLNFYFLFYTISTLLGLPFNIFRLKVYNCNIWDLLYPKWNGSAFKEILNYSLAIFVMGIFQVTANNLRPLLLGRFASVGVEVLTEYRVIQTIVMLVVAFGGVFMQVLLPSISKVYAEKNHVVMQKIIYDGTKYISIFFAFIVFGIIVSSNELLLVYMGPSYSHLYKWLVLWLITVLLSMHNSPVASLVLSTGKTKPLVYSSAISCVVSLPITMFLAPSLNVGAAVIGYFVYIFLQIAFYYLYYIPYVLNLDGVKIFFKSFLPITLVGIVSCIIVLFLKKHVVFDGLVLTILLNSLMFFSLFSVITLSFIMRPQEIKLFLTNFSKK